MLTVRNSTDVRLVVPLQDADGNDLSVTAVSYRVSDRNGDEVVPMTELVDFLAQSPEAVISVPAASNALPAGVARDLRAVEIHCVAEGNTVVLHEEYAIELPEPLTVGVNTFQTLAQAEFNAAMIPNLAGWMAATDQDKMAALVEARLQICQLNFRPMSGRNFWGQDSLYFIPEGVGAPSNYAGGGYIYTGDLAQLSPEQYARLPLDMRDALCRAQIAQANALLGGEPMEDKRAGGVMLDTVGESKMMFRDEKPLQLPVCRRALSYLGRYITFAKVVAR